MSTQQNANTSQIRLSVEYYPWEKYIWLEKDSGSIHNSIIKFSRTVYVNKTSNNHNKRSEEDLIDFFITNRAKAIKEKKDGPTPSQLHHGDENDIPLEYTDQFESLVASNAPHGYVFHRVGFYVKPRFPKDSNPSGNIEIQYKKQAVISTSSYSQILKYPSGNELDRLLCLNIHLAQKDVYNQVDGFDSDLLTIFGAFHNVVKNRDQLRQLEELGVEKLSCNGKTFGIHPGFESAFERYKASKKRKAVEPLSPLPPKKSESKGYSSEENDLLNKIESCLKILGEIGDENGNRSWLLNLKKQDFATIADDQLEMLDTLTQTLEEEFIEHQKLFGGEDEMNAEPSSPSFAPGGQQWGS